MMEEALPDKDEGEAALFWEGLGKAFEGPSLS